MARLDAVGYGCGIDTVARMTQLYQYKGMGVRHQLEDVLIIIINWYQLKYVKVYDCHQVGISGPPHQLTVFPTLYAVIPEGVER
jgi:hypothetical protein